MVTHVVFSAAVVTVGITAEEVSRSISGVGVFSVF